MMIIIIIVDVVVGVVSGIGKPIGHAQLLLLVSYGFIQTVAVIVIIVIDTNINGIIDTNTTVVVVDVTTRR